MKFIGEAIRLSGTVREVGGKALTPLLVDFRQADAEGRYRTSAAIADPTRDVAYGTEADPFQAAGVPSIICSPVDIRPNHRPNEFIAIEQIERCENFLASLIVSLARK